MARSRYYQFALSSTRAAHLGSPGSPGRCTSNIALIPIGGIQQWALDISASAIGARMQQPHLTATAVENANTSLIFLRTFYSLYQSSRLRVSIILPAM